MLRFVAILVPAMVLAVQAELMPTTSTTPSPQAALLNLAASADQTIGSERAIDVEFSCANRPLGYYADMANDCRLYHVCNPANLASGEHVVIQYSFFCPGGQRFDQQAMICVPTLSIPCNLSEKYYPDKNANVVLPASAQRPTPAGQKPAQTVFTPVPAPAPVVREAVTTTKVTVPAATIVTMPATKVTVPTTTVTKPVTVVNRAPVVTNLNFDAQPVQHHAQTQPGIGFQVLTHQHQEQFISHFPEANFHQLPTTNHTKVLRLG